MKGKMFLILGGLFIMSYLLYQWKGDPHKMKEREKKARETVTGIISNSNGEPISKATIYLLGAETKARSNDNGKYTIEAVIGDELVVSHPKYNNLSIEVKSKNENFTLEEKGKELKDQARKDFPDMEVQ